MTSPIRVLIPGDSQDPDTLSIAIAYAQEIAKKEGTQDILLITHTKGQLRHSDLSTNLGAAAAKALDAGRAVSLSSGATLRHGTLATLRYGAGQPVVIAYYANEELLDFVDGMSGIKGAVAVPWIADKGDQWRERWNPIVHGEEKQAPAAIVEDPVVETALRSVSRVINLSYSLLQTRDKQWVDQVLRILRAKGHALVAEKIRNWAIRNGWKPSAADELAKLVNKIGGLKTRPRLTDIPNAETRYARWKGGED